MSSPSNPLPVILCGRRVEIGKPVAEILAPEFEVIHFCMDAETAITQIPRLLKGDKPQSPDHTGIGTQNYTQVPRAVVFGRGYELSDVEAMKAAAEGYNVDPVVWIAGDPHRKSQPNEPQPGPGYAQFAAGKVKEKLMEWQNGGCAENGLVLW
ncbi:Uncharacterized protein PECH_004179 [Penicillium ucsense]|uniref:Uncharacterized protein n=1 Tax=Penicillium ucsense TaxID=2839758 RepID=A0A8J8WM95_9EURO|nr:Uncharacterized protein PECM_005586 [Penicillium ucsense]KAF7737261.1 Uncharacterized protein PECH_004179 [Penicillium ucsense]